MRGPSSEQWPCITRRHIDLIPRVRRRTWDTMRHLIDSRISVGDMQLHRHRYHFLRNQVVTQHCPRLPPATPRCPRLPRAVRGCPALSAAPRAVWTVWGLLFGAGGATSQLTKVERSELQG